MKKTVSLLLALLTVLSLASCASLRETSGESSSSEFSKYETWLAERGFDTSAFVFSKSGADVDVDLNLFSDDGYVIDAEDGEVVIVGKTDAGLDRAVRCYAKYGNPYDYYVSYGEGYRIASLTVCGYDISEYSVICDEPSFPENEYARDAAGELVKYIKKACGADLPVYEYAAYNAMNPKPARAIYIASDYANLGDEGFTINIGADGNVRIYGGRYRGCLYGVYDLLRDMGWRFIADVLGSEEGNRDAVIEYLYKAENVNLTPALNRTELPAIGYRQFWDGDTYSSNVGRLGEKNYQNSTGYCTYGLTGIACHGLHNYRWLENAGLYAGLETVHRQPCFTDEANIECIVNSALNEVAARLAARQVIGREIVTIDVSQYDEGAFCECPNCLAAVKYDGSQSGPVLKMTNRVAAALAERYPGVNVSMLAYNGTNKPPEHTRPLDNVRISYCVYVGSGITCSHHCISGEDCDPESFYTNVYYAEELNAWAAMCNNRNLDVWYYPFNCYGYAFQSPYFTTLYDDMKYLTDKIGVNGIMFHTNNATGALLHSLTAYLGMLLSWDGDMTREEYDAATEEWFDIIYGDAGESMYLYFTMNEYAAGNTDCWCSFHSPNTSKVDNGYYAENFDFWYDLFERAKDLADTEHQAHMVELYESGMLYMEIGITYKDRYTNGTAEERAEFETRYRELHRIFRENNLMVFNDFVTREYAPATLDLSRSPFDAWCTEWSN